MVTFMSAKRAALPPCFFAYSKFALTAAASTGLPSENFIPDRRRAVTPMLFGANDHDVATSGSG